MDEADRQATTTGGRCANCFYVFAPAQAYGCERCGVFGDALETLELPAGGTVTAAAMVYVHRHPIPVAPFGVAEVVLDAGPVIRVLTDGPVVAGQRVTRGADGADGLARFVAEDRA